MRPSFLATSLSLLSCTRAGEIPFDISFPGNFCSVAENNIFPSVTSLHVEEDHHHDSGSCSQSHDESPKVPPFAPWTFEPQCLRDKNSQEFCVYTNTDFANSRGISFFTSPSIAERVASLPAFIQPAIHSKTNNFANPPWEIRNIPGRGNGLFATRKLHRGDEIISDTPVGVYQSDALFPDYKLGYPYLRKTFDQLPNSTKEIVLRTAANHEGDMIMERINTNAFAGEFEGAPHFLLYPETSLMNHDCRPNAMYNHDPSTLIHTTYASRTILPGEEITITYINILEPRDERQSVLKSVWGFTCTCALCSASPSQITTSNERLAHIAQLQTALVDWSPNSTATPEMALRLISLFEEEEVHAARGMGHMFAALAYNAVGDTSKAKKYARMALEAGLVGSGEMKRDEREMTALRARPREHWSFMTRRKR